MKVIAVNSYQGMIEQAITLMASGYVINSKSSTDGSYADLVKEKEMVRLILN
jgi:hypothetical protein